MEWYSRLKRYRDERHALVQLGHKVDHLRSELGRKTKGIDPRSEDYNGLVSEYFFDLDVLMAEIAHIETVKMIRRAGRWRIPVPQRPLRDDQEDEYWEWHSQLGRYYLSEKGASRLRREVYQESEMFWKPWLSWCAIAISIVSLGISVFRP